jgi:hypothetical protein
MDTPSGGKTTANSTTTGGADTSQVPAQITESLAGADSNAVSSLQNLLRVHQARLARGSRTVTALTARFGANDPRVASAAASVAATNATISRVSLVNRQASVPPVQVSANGWALHGRVVNSQLQPAARFTVFLVDGNKAFLREYGFAYTDDTGYFLINHPAGAVKTEPAPPGQTASAAAPPELFIEIANTDANPVYLAADPFQPVTGGAVYQTIVLPAGGKPIGDPPPEIRRDALPDERKKS